MSLPNPGRFKDLPAFLGDPDVELMAHANLLDGNNHEYGAFILAEYFEERYGTDFIRRTWERVGQPDGVGAMEAVEDVIANQQGETLQAKLPDFWQRAYQLGPSDFSDADRTLWIGRLEEGGPTDSDDHGSGRPARQVFRLNRTSTATGESFVERGGAAFVDFVHYLSAPGQLEIQLKNYLPGFFLLPTDDDIDATLYSYSEYPNLCRSPVDLILSAGGVASQSVALSEDCTFSTLVVSHYDIHGGDKTQEFAADCSTCPLFATRNNAEGGVDELMASFENTGGASGDQIDICCPHPHLVFDDDGYVSDGAFSYRLLARTMQLGLLFDPAHPPVEVVLKVNIARNSYPVGAFKFMRTEGAGLGLRTDGRIDLYDQNIVVGTTTNPIPLGQMIRVEMRQVASPTAGLVQVKLFATANGTTPLETLTIAGVNTGDYISIGQFGFTMGEPPGPDPWWIDEMEVHVIALVP